MRLLLLISALFFPWLLLAQEPCHISFDMENGAPTNTFYSLIDGDDGYLYLGSDMGMYRFDGMKFIHITNKELGTTDIARLQKDEKGNIWGMTFKNHLVKVSGDTLEIVLRWNHANDYFMDYTIENSNTVWLSSENDSLYKYNVEKKEAKGYFIADKRKQNPLFPSNIIENKVYCNVKGLSVNSLETNAPSRSKRITNNAVSRAVFTRTRFVRRKKSNFIYFPDLYPTRGKYLNLYQVRNDSIILPPEWLRLSERISHISQIHEDLLISTARGLLIRSEKKQYHWLNEVYCSEAKYYETKGLWVTTLGKGLLYFPNYRNMVISNKVSNENTTKLMAVDSTIYIGTGTGDFLSYNPKKEDFKLMWRPKEPHRSEGLTYSQETEQLAFNALNELLIYNVKTKKKRINIIPSSFTHCWDSVIVIFTPSTRFMNFSQGDEYSPILPKFLREKRKKERYVGNINDKGIHPWMTTLTQDRPYSGCINKQDTTFWVATRNQLTHFTRERIDTIRFQNRPIISTSIEMADDGTVWAATSTGVLQIQGDSVIQRLDESNVLRHENISSLRIHGKNLYLISNEGFQQYNTETRKLKFYNELDGLPKGTINDIEELDGYIYVGMNKGLIRVILREDAMNNLKPKAVISEIFINEIPLKNQHKELNLAYDENNLRIDIASIALRSLGQHTYQYKLEGIDTEWTTLPSSSRSIRFPNLGSGLYKFQLKVLNEDGVESDLKTLKIHISPPFWKTWWFITSLVLGFGIITAIIVYLRFQTINERLKLEKALKYSEMKAIRAQMNPHFIFNALNSIQSLVLQKNYSLSNHYLGKFSNLVRIILMMSEQQKVTVREEIEMLKLYLDLEKLRFDDIQIDFREEVESHEQEELVIPPMLTQPHVENALKHGLLHKKKGSKNLSIHFFMREQYLGIEITDNGVGRKQRAEMQKRSLKKHKSYSTEANLKRVELLNQNREEKIITQIENLDDSLLDTGTRVTLFFPIEYDY